MIRKIDRDYHRFKDIIKGRIKQNLKKYITKGELVGAQGKNVISVPLPQIEIPRFRFGDREMGGVGQGDGKVGQVLGKAQEDAKATAAGNEPAEHALEVEVSLEDLAKMLSEELKLPRIQPKGSGQITHAVNRYSSIRQSGTEGLRHFKRTYKEALKRQIAQGEYNPQNPVVVPIKRDKRYRFWKSTPRPQFNAAIIYIMDVSGSMGDEQKEIVRIESFWIDTWLRSQYDHLVCRYIIHDAQARQVDQDTFYHTRESGGTLISSAYKLAKQMIENEFPQDQWNIYIFHFSDGDNWSGEDTKLCVELLQYHLLPWVNLFCYGQVESRYGSGQFIKDLRDMFPADEKLVTSKIEDKEAIYRSIQEFLGKGK
ncbi:MAG: DUF444 family protein [Deltaproteobacteria bacterium]|nr:DUF444 family protein [Deltaproteobacteria bacterium]